MKKHLVWIIALLAGLFSSCLIDREAEARAEQNLQEVGELYHTEKSICDSLLDVATSYYLPDLAKGDTTLSSLTSSPQQAECMLYEGILHHDRAQELRPDIEAYTAEMAKAYRLFLEVERNMKLLNDPYLKGVVNNRLAIVNVQNENYRQALSYYRKELCCAIDTKDTTSIAVAYMHLSYPFNYLNEGDSTLYYCNQALYYAPYLEGRQLAALYNNIVYYRKKFKSTQMQVDSLLYQIPFESCSRDDSCRINYVIADYYIENGSFAEADSLIRWAISHSNDKPMLLSMAYKRLAVLFEQIDKPDSALTYRKAWIEQQKLIRLSDLGTELAVARGRYENVQQQQHYEIIVVIIVIIAASLFITILLLWVQRTYRVKLLERRIASVNKKMDQQIAESQDKEKQLKQQYMESIRNNHSLHVQIEYMLRRFILLDLNASWPSSIFEELLAIYRESSPERRHLIDELNNLSLTPRHKAICLLISEKKHNPKQLWLYAGCASEAAFQSTKSQIKRKLKKAAPSSSIIQSLLKCFNLEHGPTSKPIPKLKNEGK